MTVESPPKGAEKTALYCYGVVAVGTEVRRLKSGLGGKPVEPLRHGDVAALTSVVPRGRVRARRSDLLTHFDVLGDAFEHGTVLPLRFGIVFEDEASLVEAFLSPRHDELGLGVLEYEAGTPFDVELALLITAGLVEQARERQKERALPGAGRS